jgi:hypothetical protein
MDLPTSCLFPLPPPQSGNELSERQWSVCANYPRSGRKEAVDESSAIRKLSRNGLVAMNPNCRHPYKANLWDCAFDSGTRRLKPYVVLIVSGATAASIASRQAVAPKSIASTLAAASSCMCGRT